MSTIGKRFLAAVIKQNKTGEYLRFGKIRLLFKNHELDMFDFVDKHAKQYGKLPSADTVLAGIKEELPDAPEPPEFYFDQLKDRHIELCLKDITIKAGELLQPGNKKPKEALDLMVERLMDVARVTYSQGITDYRDAVSSVWPDYVAKVMDISQAGIELGWPTLDQMTGGVIGGDMVSFVGRPATGKSFNLLWSALHTWKAQNRVPLFISMEMKPLLLEQRLAAMDASVPLSHLKVIGANALTSIEGEKLKKTFTKNKAAEQPFWIVDGNLSTSVEEIYNLCRQLKPDVVFIDGAYMLKHPNPRMDRYTRVAENCELLKKDVCTNLNIPTVCSWQFSREANKKKKDERPGLDDIAYSDVIGQVSSVVLGIFEEESVETLAGRRIDILKGRSGETGFFRTAWDFHKMSFSEIKDKELEDLIYV